MIKKFVLFVCFVSFWSKSGFVMRVTNNYCLILLIPDVCQFVWAVTQPHNASLQSICVTTQITSSKETEGAFQIFYSDTCISVGNFGLPFKTSRLFGTFSGRSNQNCLAIYVLTEIFGTFG